MLDSSPDVNFETIFQLAEAALPPEMAHVEWGAEMWTIYDGPLTSQSGKRRGAVTLSFQAPPLLAERTLEPKWRLLIQCIVVLRFSQSQQALSNLRSFIHSAAFVAIETQKNGLEPYQVSEQLIDRACRSIESYFHKSANTRYGRLRAANEFVNQGALRGVFHKTLSTYSYSRMVRPPSVGGLQHKRLDESEAGFHDDSKMVDPKTIGLIGELYRVVPRDHKYRLYVLMLSFLCLLGRRFSEVAYMPLQRVKCRESGRCSLYYFPKKQSRGAKFISRRALWLSTGVVKVVTEIVNEMNDISAECRRVAEYMVENGESDTRFMDDICSDQRIYSRDLNSLGLPSTWLDKQHWLSKNGWCHQDVAINGRGRANYVFKEALVARCNEDYHASAAAVKMTDQHGTKYFLPDLLLLRPMGSSSGSYCPWVATECTHSMLSTFLRYLPALSKEFLPEELTVNFTSHSFRHTINTLLDDGGLSEMAQAEWFGRGLLSQNQSYQHTTLEQKALNLKNILLSGNGGGYLADLIVNQPSDRQRALIDARMYGVHDIGLGWCMHPLTRSPCPKAAQCQNDCSELVYDVSNQNQTDAAKEQLRIVFRNLKTVAIIMDSDYPRASVSWVEAQSKAVKYLTQRLLKCGVTQAEIDSLQENALTDHCSVDLDFYEEKS
ncbi:hypothetical protein [Pseudomonas sp. NPDC099000]|uniref:hypothetical protein n=1 Tax=Pseudomonas sp. NPDC099000 TaxID=3364488 RepID=UPI00383AC7AC